MNLVDLQAPAANMVFVTRGGGFERTVQADENGLITGIEAGGQAFRDLLNSGCYVVPKAMSAPEGGQPA